MAKRTKLFIVEFEACNGEKGIQVVRSSNIAGLTRKMWMLKHAKVIEVEPIQAWIWNDDTLESEPRKAKLRRQLVRQVK